MGLLERTRNSKKGSERTKSSKRSRSRQCVLLLAFSLVVGLPLLQWLLSFPPPLFMIKAPPACSEGEKGYVLEEGSVCADACGKVCFPRVRGLCVSHSQVTVCEDQPPLSEEVKNAGGLFPEIMRFRTQIPRARFRVKRGRCPGWDSRAHRPTTGGHGHEREARWIIGTQMVADLKLMPDGPNVGPNPHHEAEKLIPAILLNQLYGLKNASLHWFAAEDPQTVSRWSLGLIKVFEKNMKVKFMDVPEHGQPQVCFEDAIVFSGLTNGGYMPNVGANDWLRNRVLTHCKIPATDADRPINNLVVLKRINSSRSIDNMLEIQAVLERELMLPMKLVTSGVGDFCEQVRVVAEADFAVTPHGSHNINFLFARPYATILEAFPLLYYIDWFSNYVHAARINHYEIHGTWPEGSMPLRMRMYALLFGWKNCFSVRECMNYAKSQRVAIDIDQLQWLLRSLTTTCRVAVSGSWCLTQAGQKSGMWKEKGKLNYQFNHPIGPRWRKQQSWRVTQDVLPEKKG